MKITKITAFLIALSMLLVMTVGQVTSVSGAAYTTFNAHVDGAGKDVCKNSPINCNIYGAKEYVWLNGGPTANGLGPDGDYFFAVLVPGGQPNPNDGGPKNLSDDYDLYTNRTFTVEDGEVYAYTGTHWLDSGRNEPGPGDPKPNGLPPYIRLFPYADTWNPGGVYILAICSLAEGYPVEPRDCKYDAFKVKPGKINYQFMLEGIKFYDRDADGPTDTDPGLEGWRISITGTDPNGNPIDEIVTTGPGGYWWWESPVYTFPKNVQPGMVTLQVCEIMPEGSWHQTWPDTANGCYDWSFIPSGYDFFGGLDFGNYCEAYADFDTKGYWHNKNGLQELTEEDRDYVNGLAPYSAPSDYFGEGDEPFDGYFQDGTCVEEAYNDAGDPIWGACTWQSEISHFLVDANAGGDPREQLAQQLLAFIFNTRHRLDNPGATIVFPGVWEGSAQELIDYAIQAWLYGPAGLQTYVQELLNDLNESDSVPYIPYEPCPIYYPY